jgi:putative peptidoglycan lipid II flippase
VGAEEPKARGRARIGRAVGLVSALTMLSRLLGLVREQLFAALLGAGFYSDAYQTAFRIPNLLRDLFAEGALSAAFVPTFTDVLTNQSKKDAFRLASRLMTLLVLVLAVVVAAGILFAGPIVAALSPGFLAIPGKAALAARLTRIMMPFLPLVSMAAVAMGMLNAQERFGAPALSSSMFNLVTIACGAGFFILGWPPERVVVGWSVAVLVGGAAQYLIQVPPLGRQGFRFQPELAPSDPGLRRIGRLMAPATVGLAAVQINIFVGSIFASRQDGGISWISYAFRLLYLPIGLFGVAIGTIATTGLAKRAAERDMAGMRETLNHALRLVGFLTIPSTVGLAVLSGPIVRLLYQHGRFKLYDTRQTAAAVQCYAIGLFAYSAVKVLAPAFYALDRARVPVVASLSAVVTNAGLNLALYRQLGFMGVALGTSVGALVNFGVLAVRLQKEVGGIRGAGLGGALIKMTAASMVMGAAAYGTAMGLEALPLRGIAFKLVTCIGPILVGTFVYAAITHLLGLEEIKEIAAFARKRLRPPRPSAP